MKKRNIFWFGKYLVTLTRIISYVTLLSKRVAFSLTLRQNCFHGRKVIHILQFDNHHSMPHDTTYVTISKNYKLEYLKSMLNDTFV